MPPGMASPGFAFPASRVTPNTLDWPVTGTDPSDDWWREGSAIVNRSWHLWRNNPYALAMVRTMVEGAVGQCGLTPRSLFNRDVGLTAATDPTQVAALVAANGMRSQVEKSLRSAYQGKRFDAVGQYTKRDMTEIMLVSCVVAGDAWSVRQWKPNRPGRQYQSTCWRIVDSARVSNPNFGNNTATRFEGIELDDDGCPIGIWIQKRNPYAVQVVDWTWDYTPWYAPDGSLNVTHMMAPGRPDQLRGVGWFSSIMGLVNQLGSVTDAFVVAKRVQACIGIIRSSMDQGAAATAGKNGSTNTGAQKLYPGMIMDVPSGTTVTPLQWNFQGNDHSQFQDSMLQAITAAWGLPMEYVQHRLTKSNLASARVALMQAYRTFATAQEMLISHVEQPWAESVIREEMARGRLPSASDDQLDDMFSFKWNRPARPYPDPLKEWVAAKNATDMGVSPSTAHAQQGLDFASEILQSQQDATLMAAHGVQLNTGGNSPTSAPGSAIGNIQIDDGSADTPDNSAPPDGTTFQPQTTGQGPQP